MRELKDELVLGAAPIRDLAPLRGSLEGALHRLDACRPRRTRGWRTACEADAALPSAIALVSRSRFYAAAHCTIRRAVLDSCSKRERRRATREAVLQTMQRFQLITRTRGGTELTLATSYTVS